MPKLDTAHCLTVKHLKMTKDCEIFSRYPDLKTDNTSAHLSAIRRELVKSVIRIKDLPLHVHYKSFFLNITYFFLTGNRPRCTLYLTLEKREQVSCPEHKTSIIDQWSLGEGPAVYYLSVCGVLRITSDPLTAHCLNYAQDFKPTPSRLAPTELHCHLLVFTYLHHYRKFP